MLFVGRLSRDRILFGDHQDCLSIARVIVRIVVSIFSPLKGYWYVHAEWMMLGIYYPLVDKGVGAIPTIGSSECLNY